MVTAAAEIFYTLYQNNNALSSVLTGGLWYVQAPQTVILPYAVYRIEESEPQEICGAAGSRIERSEIVLTFYTNKEDGGSVLASLISAADTVFHWTALNSTISNKHVLSCRRTFAGEMNVEDDLMIGIMRFEMKIAY
ncbi:MAG TPA: hypothetical protein PLV55_12845 [Anaerohalosphaeraceae bacterium]|nr:hypothetical protein [Anaerohalosphaeraceae bacterium]